MPFVAHEIREALKQLGFGVADAVGDICCAVYTEMLRRWKENPRWTTAHYIKKEFVRDPKNPKYKFLTKIGTDLTLNGKMTPTKFDYEDVFTAASLAWDVFFMKYVWPYELDKIKSNGDIE
jgi:signal recognition particle subunit SEC65